jgi:hypothetical protein
MRKVDLEVEATVLIPVKVLLDVTVRADDDANIEDALKRYSQGRKPTTHRARKADVEEVSVVQVLQIGQEQLDDPSEVGLGYSISDALSEALEYGGTKFELGKMKVCDSR